VPDWCAVGEGEIDYKGLFDALKSSGYTGVISLETHFKGTDGNIEAASRRSLENLKRLLEQA